MAGMKRMMEIVNRPNATYGVFCAILVHENLKVDWSWRSLERFFLMPTARPGIYIEFAEINYGVFIPFDQKIPFEVKLGKRGYKATQTTPSQVNGWKNFTKIMGDRKREFVQEYV